MTLTAAITRLQVHSLACTGVKAAPDDPADTLPAIPFAVAYPERGIIMGESADTIKGIHTIVVEFHVGRTLLPAAISQAKGYIEEFGKKLVGDPTLNGTVTTILMDTTGNVTYEFGRLEWASTTTIGVRFHIPVKIRGAI